jgi:DME family drug/metabolite transporter
MLSASPVVYALAAITAVLWGFAPVLDRQGMDAGGTTVQASTVVVVVDSLLALQGFDAFADLSLATLRLFLAAGFVGTALGRLAVFAGVRRVGVALIVVGGVLVALG